MHKRLTPLAIATQELRACYDKLGIVAGRHNYDDYWTRDAYYGWLGALGLGEHHIVTTHLDTLLSFQQQNGLIPYLIRQKVPGLPFIGIKKQVPPIACFRSPKALFTSTVIDSNFYYIAGVYEYYKTTKDASFLKKHLPHVLQAFQWYQNQLTTDHLLQEGYIAQWNDGIYKKGYVAITNMQVYQAAMYTAKLLKAGGQDSTEYETLAQEIKLAITNHFWNGTYYIDWIDGSKKYTYFDSIANMLAILWEIADKSQAAEILSFTSKNAYTNPLVTTSFPAYPYTKVELVNLLFGVGSYWQGTNVFWIEPALLYCQALKKTGNDTEAQTIFSDVTTLVTKYGGVFETYQLQNKLMHPFKRMLYRSEHPYARGAGMFVTTAQQLDET